MKITIDSKIHKLCNRPLEKIPEKQQLRHCVQEIARHIQEDRDCLLVIHPASPKTQILFAIANMYVSPDQKMRMVLPENRSFLQTSYLSQHIYMQSYDSFLHDTSKKCAALFVDEGERIDDSIVGERLESLLIESDPNSPLVLSINLRANIDDVAKWLSNIRKRKCMIIQGHCPKIIVPSYFTHKGEWLPLLDRKKLNRKVKNHLKTIKTPIPLKKILFQCIDFINAQQLRPAIFVLPEITTIINLWNKLPEKESTPGQYMTAPQIVSIMNNAPNLKDNPFVLLMLKKRAGICFNDQTWQHLLECFFSMGALDIILTPLDTIGQLHCSGKSLILMAHPEHDAKNTDIALWYEQLLMRSGSQTDFMDETSKQYCFCILTDAPDVSPVHVKENLDSSTATLQSHFKWNLHNVLGKIARNRSSLDDLNQSFLVATQGARNNVLFHDAMMEVQAEFPHARCIPVSAMSFLNSMRIKWTNELTDYSKQKKSSSHKSLETKFQITKFLLDCIPCNDCQHESLCHHRGSKRFRELIDTFYAFHSDSTYGHLLLETTIPFYYKLLQELNWIDSNNKMTSKGQLAYQWGSLVNPLFIECLYKNILPKDNQRLYASILAGFLPEEWHFRTNIDLRYPAISASYQEFWPYLKETAKKMLALGLYPRIPEYQLSCIHYALTDPVDRFEFMQQIKINQMTLNMFMDRVNRMHS